MTHKEIVEAMLAEHSKQLFRILELLEKKEPSKKSEEWIELPTREHGKQTYYVPHIIMLEGAGSYTNVYRKETNQLVLVKLSRRLGHWQGIFNDFGFLRLHNRRVINPCCIVDYSSLNHYLELPFSLSFKVKKRYAGLLGFYFHRQENKSG